MEEIYLSADGLYEYSVAEINAAATRDKVTFEEFISSKGMKLKGGEVEETIEVEEKEPLTPNNFKKQAEVNKINKIAESAKNFKLDETIIVDEPEPISFDDINADLMKSIVEDNKLVDLPTMSVINSPNFQSWINSETQKERSIEEEKTLDVLNQPDISNALVTNNFTVENVNQLRNLGVKNLPEFPEGATGLLSDQAANNPFTSAGNYSPITSYNDLVDEALNDDEKIIPLFAKAQTEEVEQNRFNFFSNIVKQDNNNLKPEELENKVRGLEVENMIKTSDAQAKNFLGEELYNRWSLASTQEEKNKILKEKFGNVKNLIDEDGNLIRTKKSEYNNNSFLNQFLPSSLKPEEVKKVIDETKQELEAYTNTGIDQLFELYNSAANDVASFAKLLYAKGSEGIMDQALPTQKANEFLMNIGIPAEDGDKSLKDDFKNLEQIANTGVIPEDLSFLPRGGNKLVNDYNKALKKLQTIQTAIGLNTDLTKVKRQEGFDILGKETKNVFGFETLGINEMQNTLLYAFQDDLGIEAKEKEIAKMGLPGEIYVKQPNEEYFSEEKLLAQMPGFAKMGAEVYFSMGIIGGVLNLPKITAGAADLIVANTTRLGMSEGAATRFAQFSVGTFQESAGLVGSNTIGSNLTGSEKMPVIPFAVGSQLGHLGTNWLGEVIKGGLAITAKNNKYLGNVVNFFNRMPGGSTLGGAVKFVARPALSAGAIKSGEFTSGVADIVKENLGFGKADMDMSELWHHITDADSFLETYGALMFMSAAHPSQMKVNAVKNFEYDMLKLKTNMPEWNRLASEIGLEARGSKKGGRTSWSFFEIREAVDKKLNEISTNAELTPEQARDQIAQTKALGKRLGIKRVLDSELASADGKLNWNQTYKNLQLTLNSIKAGNSVDAKDIKNLTDAGFANGGATPILELQGLGFDEVTATNLVKHAETSYNEAQEFFATDSKNFESYIESGIVEMQNNGIKENLKKQYDSKNLSETAFKFKTEQAEKQIKIQQEKQRILIDLSRGDAKQRIKETSDYVDQVVGEGFDIKRLSNKKYVELKSELGEEQKSTSIGYGFQTTIDGKPTFVINKDAMLEGGVFRFESGGKTYKIGQGFKGSTEKHEVFHGVFENKFDARSVEARARELAGAEGDLYAARETIKRQDIEYIDSFIQRLKDVGIYNRVEAEMKLRPDYIELKKRGGRNIQIEKEFINEYLELQNEGKLNSLIEGVEFKNVNADVVTKLNNGADVVDYFAKGVEQTPEGKAKVKEALDNYKELVKEGDTPINLSEKNLKDLTKEYKENKISREDLGKLIQQYTASGIAALKRIASIGKRKVPVDTKNPKITEGIADLLVLEFDSFTRNYDPAKAEVSTYMNKIAERILPKYVEKFKPNENVRIDDLTVEVADTKTPETDLVDKESEIKETERLVSVFEGKEAKAKQKEIIEVFEDLRSNPEKLEKARIKGFGGTPKEQLGKVAELLFNIPDGTKVSNPSKNVLPTIKIIDLKGKKITPKQLDAGKKGIVDAKDFVSLRDYFKDKNNLRRFLNASLPEYNVNTPQSIINVKGENIQVSPDVVGRGIRLPDRIYDYFYEQFVDPTGVMTSPSGRGKGKTSQVQKVYKIKPEFRKPTNEVIDKVLKDILADVKTDDLPSKYNRNIAQLVKGMSLVETMAVSNQAKRTKLPAETAAEKQLIADIKSSSSKLSMSEKIAKATELKRSNFDLEFNSKNIKDLKLDKKENEVVKSIFKLPKEAVEEISKAYSIDLSNKKVIDNIIKSDKKATEALADEIVENNPDLSKEEILKDIEDSGLKWRNWSKVNKIENIPLQEKLSSENIANYRNFGNKFVDNIVKKLGGLENLSKDITSSLAATLGFGNAMTSIPRMNSKGNITPSVLAKTQLATKAEVEALTVKKDRNVNGKNVKVEVPIKYKPDFNYTKSEQSKIARSISDVQAIERLLEREAKDAIKPTKRFEKIKYAWQPKWDYSTKGIKKLGEEYADKLNKDSNYNIENFVRDIRNDLTHPELRNSVDGYEKTMEANSELLNVAYESLSDYYFKSKDKTLALKDISNFLQQQTNAATGLFKGMASMESATTRPTEQEVKGRTHNEHQTDLLAANQNFIGLLKKYKGKNKTGFKEQLRNLTDQFKQALISRETQRFKDDPARGGAGKMSSENYLANTFADGSAINQIILGGPNKGKTVLELLQNQYGNKIVLEALKDIPKNKVTEDVIRSIQKIEYEKEFKRVKKNNIEILDEPGVMNTSEKMTTEELVKKARTIDKALQMADRPNMPKKKIRIFDFDDTVAKTNSKVFAEREGKRIELTAEEFAEKGMELIDQGYEMDFTDFNKVVEGKKGPLFDLIKKLKEAPGERDLFILTARAPESQQAIFEFMKAMGVEIPLENITGLGKSDGEAKANWIIDKAAEGYNDFYFADDAPQNVKAVKTAMSQLDVKSKVQLAKENKINFSEKKTKELDWKTDKAGNIKTTFNIGKKKYNFNLDARDSKGSFDVEFNLGGRIDMTGTGDAVKVIRTVYNGLLDVVGKTPKIKRLEFSSLKSETSRVKLYTTLMDRVAKKLGWETDIWESNDFITPDKSSYDFEITKPRKKQVAPVEKALNVIDVKSKVQKARLNTSEKMNTTFNEIIEQSTGIDAVKIFSDVKAQVRGGKKKGQKFFIPPSAEDFLGLLYTTLPKGRKGEKAMKFYQDALLDPYTRAMTNLSTSRVNLMSDFKALKKQLDVPKDLKKETESGFTNEQAVRVYLWNKVGEKIPGLSKTDLKELSDIVEKDPKLKVFADEILSITKGDGYSKPGEGWANGTITTDLVDILNTTKRGKYLETWNENVDVVFSKDNLNKLEAAYGKKYREAVENSLSRMKKGSNRVAGGNRLSNQVLDYINNSTGVTMFINARSALLQTISAANFVNWSFNNPFQAGKAFANQPQFWKDFKQLINSDYLKDRRNGLKLNISESEIANAAKTSKNKAKAVLSYILEKGYAPTKYADSFAIAFGGASYYRNRVKDLMRNKGMSEAEANKQALIDWRAESEKSQQSSDPSKISAQQSSDLGRVILQYVNTPMQYARMQKRDVQDIANKRAMPGKTLAQSNRVRVSRIIYYAAIQNMVFNALQQGLFSLGFGDSDISDDEQKKIVNAANGMLDSSLRGLGVGGVTIQVLKNLGIDIYRRSQKDRPEYVDAWIKLLEFSPAIKSKLGRFKSAAYPFDNKKKREEVFEKGFALNNPAYESGAKVITAVTNVPLDRVISKTNNLISAFDEDTEAWMSVAMILGWPEWQLQDKGDDSKKDKKKGPFAVNKNKSNNPFAITKKKDNNPFAIK
jgi:hypothetical protein